MNTKFSVLGAIFPVLLGLSAGCGNSSEAKQEHPLVGTWELKQAAASGAATTTMVFSASSDLALTIKTSQGGLKQTGKWSAQGTELSMAFAKCLTLAADDTETPSTCQKPQSKAKYSVAGSTLTLVTTVEGTDNSSTTTLSKK